MIALHLCIVLLVSPFLLVRLLRWVGVVQQKEYRFDRLRAFFSSKEGKLELLRVLPRPRDFTRTGMKRPRLTARAVVVLVLSAVGVTIVVLGSSTVPTQWFLLSLLLLYVLIPLVVCIATMPSATIGWVITMRTLVQARRQLQRHRPIIIGIGGSYGKSSTKHLIHGLLSTQRSVFVTPRSFNTKLSVAQSILRGYRDQEIALIEYGAYIPGEIEYLTRWFQPSIAVETGFTPQHLSLFGTQERSMTAESELLAALPEAGLAFCNGSDPGALEICRRGLEKSHAKLIVYAGEAPGLNLKELSLNTRGELRATWRHHRLKTTLIGKQYAVNLQAAIAVSSALGMSDEQIVAAVEAFTPNDSFVLGHDLRSGAYLIDDGGTSNPKGFAAALELVSELEYKEKVLITAGMIDLGSESESIHRDMARKARAANLRVIHLGVDGRKEFEEVFGKKLLTDVSAMREVFAQASAHTLILIEGKLPPEAEGLYMSARREKGQL